MIHPLIPSLSRVLLGAIRPNRLKALHQLEESQWMPREKIREAQREKLMPLLSHAASHVPYYREEFGRLGIISEDIKGLEDLGRLPVLKKNIIRDNFSRLVADNVAPKVCWPSSTSGSTGFTLDFYHDRRTSNFTRALGLRGNEWTGWTIGDRHAVLWGLTADDMTTGLYGWIKNSVIHRRMFLSSYEMNNEKMIDFRQRINKFKPLLIEGYASALNLFSQFLKDHQLWIYRPKGVISTAETLNSQQREVISSAFHCRVYNRYGSREVSGIAQECEEGSGLHIFAEHVIVEVLNERDEPCRPGEIGKIVVTDLDNYAFPFIRYEIGDLGVASEKVCPCGRGLPLLASVEGRVWDVIIGANRNRLVGTFWLVHGIKGIRQFQVVQDRIGELKLNVVADPGFGEGERQKLIQRVHANCGMDMKVDIQLVDSIPPADSGKHRYIISKVSPFV
jgi:phenylacetate-CoA ligase